MTKAQRARRKQAKEAKKIAYRHNHPRLVKLKRTKILLKGRKLP